MPTIVVVLIEVILQLSGVQSKWGTWIAGIALAAVVIYGVWPRLLPWLPGFRVARGDNSIVVAISKPGRFIRLEPATVADLTPRPQATKSPDEIFGSLTWIAELAELEAQGDELHNALLAARRRLLTKPLLPNLHLSKVATEIGAWTVRVAEVVDRSRLPNSEKVKVRVYQSPPLGPPGAQVLSKYIDDGVGFLRRLRANRAFDPK